MSIFTPILLIFSFYAYQVISRWGYADDVKNICKLKKGESIDAVYARALEGGEADIRDHALRYEINFSKQDSSIRFSSTEFIGIDSREITFERVILPPFLRDYYFMKSISESLIQLLLQNKVVSMVMIL